MDVSAANIETMSEGELRELIGGAEKALNRLIAKRARSTLKEAQRMAAEVGFEVTFSKIGTTAGGKTMSQSLRGKASPKYRNPENPQETWAGRGRPPKWVQSALAEGQTLSDLTIPAEAAAAPA